LGGVSQSSVGGGGEKTEGVFRKKRRKNDSLGTVGYDKTGKGKITQQKIEVEERWCCGVH